MTLPAPYPADTRAKGWRFELDHERIRQSDTWAVAPADVRPWLLMLWMTAWEQTPCGSLPNDDVLIAARIGMPSKAYAKARAALMRGWTLADDGRLYHRVLTERVLVMLEQRRKDAARKGNQRGGTKDSSKIPTGVPRDTPVTDGTGTSTGTGTIDTVLADGMPPASPAEACKAMKSAGMQAVNPSNPKLAALITAGITLGELMAATRDAVAAGKPFAYALATAEGRRRDAATAPLPAMQSKQAALEQRNRNVADTWAAQEDEHATH